MVSENVQLQCNVIGLEEAREREEQEEETEVKELLQAEDTPTPDRLYLLFALFY